MGGRGASSSNMPNIAPSGGGSGSGGQGEPMDMNPGVPETLKEALGQQGRPMSINNAVMNANPFFDRNYTSEEYNSNCQRAVVATEGRFRGYNVIAQPTYDGDTMPRGDEWKKSFRDAKTDYIGKSTANATRKALENKMAEYGDGSRAVMAFDWKGRNANGHVINVVQRNGKTYYYDGQVGGKYDVNALFNKIRSKSVELVRVDNLDFGDRAREAVRQSPFKGK